MFIVSLFIVKSMACQNASICNFFRGMKLVFKVEVNEWCLQGFYPMLFVGVLV